MDGLAAVIASLLERAAQEGDAACATQARRAKAPGPPSSSGYLRVGIRNGLYRAVLNTVGVAGAPGDKRRQQAVSGWARPEPPAALADVAVVWRALHSSKGLDASSLLLNFPLDWYFGDAALVAALRRASWPELFAHITALAQEARAESSRAAARRQGAGEGAAAGEGRRQRRPRSGTAGGSSLNGRGGGGSCGSGSGAAGGGRAAVGERRSWQGVEEEKAEGEEEEAELARKRQRLAR